MINRRDVVVAFCSTAVSCLFGKLGLAHAQNEQTLEDFVDAEILQKIVDSDARLQTYGRLNLSSVARADLTKFALSSSISMPVRLPTKADLDIASILYFQCERFRGQHGKIDFLNESTYFMSKNLPLV